MKPALPHPNDIHIRAAMGWLELGNLAEAHSELDQISPESRTHPDVMQLRYCIFQEAQQWEACAEHAALFVNAYPEQPDGWITRSFALHELKRTREAFDLLLPGAKLFPKAWTIFYNLACYSAQLGGLEESQRWLSKARKINGSEVEKIAASDPDLQPLRDAGKV